MTGKKLKMPPLAKSLSARLLLLTIVIVMLAEVLIFAPSIARFRVVYLEEHLADAHLAILAIEATPDHMISEDLQRELLLHVGASSVALTKPNAGKLMLMVSPPKAIDASFDLREGSYLGLIGSAFMTLLGDGERVLRIVGPSPKDPAILVEVVLDEQPLRREMLAYSSRILGLSLIISLFTAALVYLSLHLVLVRPMRRITESMARFRDDPEDASRVLKPTARSDEIGVAQRELATMQQGLRAALQQKTHLAALGTAVTKINHDLRNILATARLVSDRLTDSEDPEVRRITPTLLKAIDRAVNLCAQTLNFTRQDAPVVEPNRFDLRELVDDVAVVLPQQVNGAHVLHTMFDGPFEIEADREQLHRVLSNLGHNAVEAGATRIDVSARREEGRCIIEVADNGPGLSPRAREHLFQPFAGSSRPGGTGLGLAIARELMRAHGGELRLASSTGEGTRFRLVLPAPRPARLSGLWSWNGQYPFVEMGPRPRVLTGLAVLLAAAMVMPIAAPRTQEAAFAASRASMIRVIEAHAGRTYTTALEPGIAAPVLAAMGRVPRHEFVPANLRPRAYDDRPLPIGYGQTISQPYIVALMTDLLEPRPGMKVLEVGTGSGYQAAVLAELGLEVYTIEIVPDLGRQAAARLADLEYATVRTRIGDGYYGWPEAGPFDGLLVTAAANHVPPPLVRQLKPGGRMVIPVGPPFMVQQLVLVTRTEDGAVQTRQMLPVSFVPLTGGH